MLGGMRLPVGVPWEAGRLWAGPDWGSLGENKDRPEARDAGRADTPPLPQPRVPRTVRPGGTDVFSIRTQPSSFCFIHLFQRAASKPVYTRHRKEMTAHNRQADSLSFQSSSLKPGGRGGGRWWRKNKNSTACALGFGGGSVAREALAPGSS